MNRIKYDVPKWSIYQHREARALPAAREDDGAELRFADEVFERLYAGVAEASATPDAKLSGWADRLHGEAEKSPAFQRLAASCRNDAFASAFATDEITAGLADSMRDALQPKPQKPGQPGGQPGAGDAQAAAAAAAMRAALGRAVKAAEASVDEAREALEGLGGLLPGSHAGNPTSSLDVAQVRELVRSLKSDPRVKRIALLAGRLRRIAASKRRTKSDHARDEVADVETGADLARLLPSELAKLHHPGLRLQLLQALTERKAMQYRLTGTAEKGKGPIVVCLDKSGSMAMDGRDEWATAVALSLAERAAQERRHFAIVAFDHVPRYVAEVAPGQPVPQAALMVRCDGGTSIDLALDRALAIVAEHPGALRKADVVLITDGGSDTDRAPEIRERAKELGASILACAIGMPKDYVAPWCDEALSIQRTDTVEEGAAEALFA